MKISLNWIREWIKIDASAEEIAEKLSMSGLEVEALEKLGEGLDQVVTAQILSKDKHPNADRLSLCEVTDGQQTVSLVCGAKNMKAGDKVALALPGVTLPNGLTLKETEIRKVKSCGMLCSESELGLAEESEGILILPQDTGLGIPLDEALSLNDEVLEINVTPNRGDCLSVLGIAREIAANFSIDLEKKPIGDAQTQTVTPSDRQVKIKGLQVTLESPQACPRYCGRIIRGIKVKDSPTWLQQRLAASGIRSINNIVDATNYILLERGQPMHAFDLGKIGGEAIQIRQAKAGESLVSLEGKELKLKPEHLVIADASHPLALAGVMGGEASGVTETTTDLFLESAYFEPAGIRRTARVFGMQTESGYRFERGTDPEGCVLALQALTELILQLAGGEPDPEVVDLYPQAFAQQKILLRPQRVQQVLGVEIPPTQIKALLERLEIRVQTQGEELLCEIPPFRSDLSREIDLIEEAARLYGYQKIPTSYPELDLKTLAQSKANEKNSVIQQIRRLLASWGFSEVIHYSFTSPKLLQLFEQAYVPEQALANPISEELSVMRPALLPQMVQTLQKNIHQFATQLKFFEIRQVYQYKPNSSERPFKESLHLCLGLSGDLKADYFLEKNSEVSFLDLKGYLIELFKYFSKDILLEKPASPAPFFMPTRSSALKLAPDKACGQMGELHPRLASELDLSVPVVLAEINLDLVLTEAKNRLQFKNLSPYPSIFRDLNLIVEEKVSCGELGEWIRKEAGASLVHFYLMDLYRGNPLPSGKKALTFRLEYASKERTLTDEEVNGARENLLKVLEKQLGATLR